MISRQSGLSYVEVLVAVIFLAVALVPMMNAFGPGIQGATEQRQTIETHYIVLGVLETVLAEPFTELDDAAAAAGAHTAATRYSDDTPIPYQVFIWRYDSDDADDDNDRFTGGEDDLLWIKVETEDGRYALQTLHSNY